MKMDAAEESDEEEEEEEEAMVVGALGAPLCVPPVALPPATAPLSLPLCSSGGVVWWCSLRWHGLAHATEIHKRIKTVDRRLLRSFRVISTSGAAPKHRQLLGGTLNEVLCSF